MITIPASALTYLSPSNQTLWYCPCLTYTCDSVDGDIDSDRDEHDVKPLNNQLLFPLSSLSKTFSCHNSI
jgi:hypothetical protein